MSMDYRAPSGLIVALDVPDAKRRRARSVEKLGAAARFYKVGLELFIAGGYFELRRLAHRARQQGVRRSQDVRHPGDGAARGRQPARAAASPSPPCTATSR